MKSFDVIHNKQITEILRITSVSVGTYPVLQKASTQQWKQPFTHISNAIQYNTEWHCNRLRISLSILVMLITGI